MSKKLSEYTEHELKFTSLNSWIELFFLESPEYSQGELKRTGTKGIFEGKFNMGGFSSHLEQYISAKVRGALELERERVVNDAE